MQTANKFHHKRIEAQLAKHDISVWDGDEVVAYINHGRWVADCPCNGAELVAPGEVMVCGSCGSRHTVRLPGPKTRETIEGLLEKRPPMNQNWKGESADELTAQNIENGIEVL